MRFRCLVVVPLAVSVQLGTAERSHAQDRPDVAALLQYNAEKTSEWGAVALEWIAPSVGHAYAGDFKRGIPSAAVSVAGLAMFIAGIRCDSMCAVGGDSMNNEALAWSGLAVLVVGRTWGYISAYRTAADHNAELRRRLGLTFGAGEDGVQAGLTLRF